VASPISILLSQSANLHCLVAKSRMAHADCDRGDGGRTAKGTLNSSDMVGPFVLLFHDDEYELGYVAHAIRREGFSLIASSHDLDYFTAL
jgi:hypothetical protein